MPQTISAYLPPSAAPGTAVRLLCFPHAGGGASAFGTWQRLLGPDVTVLPVQLPGRERRVQEPRFTSVHELAADLDRSLDPLLESGPYAFYGHSMGAIIAYHLTRLRAARGASLPQRLMVGAFPPPHLLAPVTEALNLSDDGLAQWLVNLGGMSQELLRYPEWVRSALALLRDDLKICHSHRAAGDPLPCPVDVFAGDRDPLLPLDVVDGWARHTTVSCDVHTVPGGHFFQQDSPEVFFPLVADLLTRELSRR
ncbi:thioesterase II family protein [Streptomyces sp. WI04-05B]|uniref:thioesterase II family protein n=1 Tax=Streptomyces TaxID=1883 RepID=UPI0029A8A1AF|nr:MULTISPECIES: alpha/beta fold hydrolase [unclassified Streptomyces]MDX2548875.1 alpha/beta fold hydrolase [Streptomyces sp. WI04-05B]MDX2590492.1 alpha/beta fold hydrolase [Streptomyces sp. WI04-05A]MDX3751520.1 alpha/beta fold hydrolase [Streptomyces sp. AK08-02]